MSFEILVSMPQALELTQSEVAFMKHNSLENTTKQEMEQQINQISARIQPYMVIPAHSCNPTTARSRKSMTQVCHYCGEKEHVGGHYKARGATYHKCNKRNHFEKVCESKGIHPTPDNGSRLSGTATSGLEGRVPQLQIKLLTQLQKAFCFLLFWILSRLFP